jgi:hypothetical protein
MRLGEWRSRIGFILQANFSGSINFVRHIALTIDPTLLIDVKSPLRIPRSKLIQEKELERAVEFATRKTGGLGGVLILIDSDDDCPAEFGPKLLDRARKSRSDLPIGVVLAKREFEA